MNKRQNGAALFYIIVLVGLTVFSAVSLFIVSGKKQRLELNQYAGQVVFAEAENILVEAENCIASQTCSNINLYNANCSNGLCFNGTNISDIALCYTGATQEWQTASHWTDGRKHRVATNVTDSRVSGKYIIEFICYTPVTLGGVSPRPTNAADWMQLYRITALAEIADQNASAMLQVTYKWK